ncbi:putative ribonuclease H-like domain-containing protein [Tanacetum coccineum]
MFSMKLYMPDPKPHSLYSLGSNAEELLQSNLTSLDKRWKLPNRKKAIGTKWVFRNKKDERGIMIRNKARLVAQGHRQEEAEILKKFNYSDVKSASTPVDLEKHLVKDVDADRCLMYNLYKIYEWFSKLQTAEDLQGDALLHYDAEIEVMNLILLSIPNDIYNSVDA